MIASPHAASRSGASPVAGQPPSGSPAPMEKLSPPDRPGSLRLAGNGLERQLPCRVIQSPLAGVSDQWTAAKSSACAAVESVKPDLSWLGKGACRVWADCVMGWIDLSRGDRR